jgi:hypothetical protein
LILSHPYYIIYEFKGSNMTETQFPTGFTEPILLNRRDFGPKHYLDLRPLDLKGFDIYAGLEEDGVADLTEIAGQKGTREYCPNDLAKRWTDIPAAEKQLGKDGGRGVVTLRSRESGQIMAFGWTGRMSDEEKGFLPLCENTFAERLHEDLRGQKLGRPFAVAIVAASMMVWDARRIGLETWGSNVAAVRSYLGAGAVKITNKDDIRPTLKPEPYDFYNDGVAHRRDIREYMQYPWSGIR